MTHKNVIIELAGRRYPALRACLTAEESEEWFGPVPAGYVTAPLSAVVPLGESGQVALVGVLDGYAAAARCPLDTIGAWDRRERGLVEISFHGPEADFPAILAEWSRLPEVAS